MEHVNAVLVHLCKALTADWCRQVEDGSPCVPICCFILDYTNLQLGDYNSCVFPESPSQAVHSHRRDLLNLFQIH